MLRYMPAYSMCASHPSSGIIRWVRGEETIRLVPANHHARPGYQQDVGMETDDQYGCPLSMSGFWQSHTDLLQLSTLLAYSQNGCLLQAGLLTYLVRDKPSN